ncbi:hypothetical protein F5983_13675 [Streptomyces arboris]|uniref:Transcription regulator AsnC/Lrp ligand binding domain-containing protein n=1 Tax=Streptomyces arboris TaxID=2600619 RepID=A0A5N5EM89_9ACTN|nr:hypothetical protein F5983_13675 [Streptomyces arboris]
MPGCRLWVASAARTVRCDDRLTLWAPSGCASSREGASGLVFSATRSGRHRSDDASCGVRGNFGAGREGRLTAKQRGRSVVIAHVEVRCAAAHVTADAERLALLPWVVSVYEVAGEFDLLLTAGAVDLPGVRRALRDDVSSLPGVGEVRSRVTMTQYGEGATGGCGPCRTPTGCVCRSGHRVAASRSATPDMTGTPRRTSNCWPSWGGTAGSVTVHSVSYWASASTPLPAGR